MINFFVDESVLVDLKHLLIEAKQNLPPFLAALETESINMLESGGKKLCFYFFRPRLHYTRRMEPFGDFCQ